MATLVDPILRGFIVIYRPRSEIEGGALEKGQGDPSVFVDARLSTPVV